MKIVLASASPRRKELMHFITDDFEIRISNAAEQADFSLPAGEIPLHLAQQKADAVFTGAKDEIIVAADTVVEISGKILGKPHSEAEAREMLRLLSGKTHRVHTGVCIKSAEKQTAFSECSEVLFYELSEQEISAYIATKEPFDKAGAYGIQGRGALLVKKINGDFYNVMGLPVARLSRELKKF